MPSGLFFSAVGSPLSAQAEGSSAFAGSRIRFAQLLGVISARSTSARCCAPPEAPCRSARAPYRSLPGPSESTFHQTVSPVPAVPRGGCPAYGKRQLAALAGRSESNLHQAVSPVPSVPRGGCPACGRRQLAALAGRLYRYMVQSFRPGISARSTSSALLCAPFRPRP